LASSTRCGSRQQRLLRSRAHGAPSEVGRTREPARTGDLHLGKADRAFSKHFQDFRSLHNAPPAAPPLRSPRPCRVACNPCDGDAAERIHEGLTRGVLVAPALLGETEDERRADRSSKARRQQTTLRRAGRTTSRVDGAAQPGRRVPSSRFTGGPLKVKLHPQPSRVNGGSSSWRRPSRPGSRPGA